MLTNFIMKIGQLLQIDFLIFSFGRAVSAIFRTELAIKPGVRLHKTISGAGCVSPGRCYQIVASEPSPSAASFNYGQSIIRLIIYNCLTTISKSTSTQKLGDEGERGAGRGAAAARPPAQSPSLHTKTTSAASSHLWR